MFNLPKVGSVLFTGHEQSWQSTIVRQLAAAALLGLVLGLKILLAALKSTPLLLRMILLLK